MKQIKGKLKFKLDQLNARIADWDKTQASLNQKAKSTNPRAYRKPGSMKGRS